MYERMNMLNMKYNIAAGIPPYVLSPDSGFKEKLT
ncbi:unknown [Clostridium sp. CAG:448]|nr:unknown [Clostridium sp. CAG:448]